MDGCNSQAPPRTLDRAGKLGPPMSLLTQDGGKNVGNLSRKYRLNEAEISLLNQGSNFIPSWRTNNFLKPNLRTDLEKYHRKFKLMAYFEKKQKRSPIPFKPKSNWSPPKDKLPEAIHEIVKKDLKYFNKAFNLERPNANLTKSEIRAQLSL